MTCHHIPSVRCPECVDRPSMGYLPMPCGTCVVLREENAHLKGIIRREAWLEHASENNIPGPYVPWDEHERVLVENARLTNKLNADSQNFEIECLKAKVEALTRERDEAREYIKEFKAGVDENYKLLKEQHDEIRAEVKRLEGLILDWESSDVVSRIDSEDAMWKEARRIRAQREEGWR